MERLTKRDGLIVKTVFESDFGTQNILNRLADYEDLEEQGRLIELPCKVGDTVWYFYEKTCEVCVAKIIKIEINYYTNPQLWIGVEYISRLIGNCYIEDRIDLMLGKTIFLTKEEAEAKLEELKGE